MYTREIELKPEGEEPARLFITVSEPRVVAVLIVGCGRKMETVCGVATCNPSDKFDVSVGAKLAVRRACNIGDEDWFSPKFARHYSVFRQMMREGGLNVGFYGEIDLSGATFTPKFMTKEEPDTKPSVIQNIKISYPIAESDKTMTVEYEVKAKKENE